MHRIRAGRLLKTVRISLRTQAADLSHILSRLSQVEVSVPRKTCRAVGLSDRGGVVSYRHVLLHGVEVVVVYGKVSPDTGWSPSP